MTGVLRIDNGDLEHMYTYLCVFSDNYLEHLLINLDIVDIKIKLNILAIEGCHVYYCW